MDLANVLLSSSGHPIPLSLLNVFRGNPRDSFETLGGVFQCKLEVGWIWPGHETSVSIHHNVDLGLHA